jgi:hypothetical protein
MARRPLLAGSHSGISTARAVPADPHLADRAVPGVRADRLDPVVPETTDRVDPADLQASDQADRVVPAGGMATPSAATSTEPRGATALRRGALARHRGRTGVGRFRHPVGSG